MSYWILEFIRVGIGYIFLMYLWPSVVFRKHLSGEKPDLSFCFLFHSFRFTDQHACSEPGALSYLRRTHCIFPFLWNLYRIHPQRKKASPACIRAATKLFAGKLGWKSFLTALTDDSKYLLVTFFRRLNQKIKGRRLEYGILSVLILFAIAYFSYGAFSKPFLWLG